MDCARCHREMAFEELKTWLPIGDTGITVCVSCTAPHEVVDAHSPDWLAAEEAEADRRWKETHPMAEQQPPRCVICHWDLTTDDVQVRGGGSAAICLRCYARETGTEHEMPKSLRLEVSRIVNGAG